MKKLANLIFVAMALAFSGCSSGEFYELKKSPCACDFDTQEDYKG